MYPHKIIRTKDKVTKVKQQVAFKEKAMRSCIKTALGISGPVLERCRRAAPSVTSDAARTAACM